MKRVILTFVFLMFGMLSFGSAFQANITVIDDIGSFSGAYLKIKSVDSDFFIEDKIYPSEFLVGVGIVKFNLEISLSEIDLNIRMIKSGRVVDDFKVGPYLINGSDILIDRREKVETVEETVEEISNITSYENFSQSEGVVEVDGESNVSEVNESVVIVKSENLKDRESFGFLTGLAMFYNEDGSINLKYSIGGVSIFLLLTILILTMILHRRKTGDVTIDEDEKELEYMEKKVKETEEKIAKIKDGKAWKNKIEKAKMKLAEEESELKELENEGNEKKIEEQEKVVDIAEEKVEKVEDKN